MRVTRHNQIGFWLLRLLFVFAVLFGLVALGGCSRRVSEVPARARVEVSPNLAASARSAVLGLSVHNPGYGNTGGFRSLLSPIGSGSCSDGQFQVERLTAIHTDGFVVLLTVGKNHVAQTATIFFPFGETTKISVLGCEVSGTFK